MGLIVHLGLWARGVRDRFLGAALWRDAESLEDAGHLVARWLREDLLYLPWDYSLLPYKETREAEGFAEAMAKVNDLGVVTLFSQPGISYQRECVALTMTECRLPLVQSVAHEVGVVVEMTPDSPPAIREATPVSIGPKGRPCTRLGAYRKSVAVQNFGCGSRRLKVDVKRGKYALLTLYDEQFARRGRVQEVLERLAVRLQAEGGQDETLPQ